MNRGTVGFLMNEWRIDGLIERLHRAKAFTVSPLEMKAVTVAGETVSHHAINEVSLLRETRETAWIEVSVSGRVVMPELICDGVLVATPGRLDRLQPLRQRADPAAGLEAGGADPDQPVPAAALARRADPRGPAASRSGCSIPKKRPVSAVADQVEVRDVATVEVGVDRTDVLTLLFDPEHALDERITMEQFAV